MILNNISYLFSHQQSIQLEMNNRRNDYDATIAMTTTFDNDKIAKLKEHWDVVWDKILTKKTLIDQALGNLLYFAHIYRTSNDS